MTRLKEWLRWLFRRGERGAILLNMQPGDSIVAMIQYREWLVLSSVRGELYFITGDRFASPLETMDMVVHRR